MLEEWGQKGAKRGENKTRDRVSSCFFLEILVLSFFHHPNQVHNWLIWAFLGVCCPIDLVSKNIGFNCSKKKVYKKIVYSHFLLLASNTLPQRQANCLSHSWSLLEWQLGSVQLKIWCFDLKCARSFSIGQSVKSKTKFRGRESLHCHYSKLFWELKNISIFFNFFTFFSKLFWLVTEEVKLILAPFSRRREIELIISSFPSSQPSICSSQSSSCSVFSRSLLAKFSDLFPPKNLSLLFALIAPNDVFHNLVTYFVVKEQTC